MPTRLSRSLRSFFVLFLASFGLPVLAEVLVVTDSRHPVRANPDARVIELDQANRIEAELSAGLPADHEQAADVARQRLQDPELARRLQSAYQDIVDARSLNVAKVPAVIVDRRFVVYGDPDVLRAVARIDAYRRQP
jgi:integrating conjugative element protein (TIGR03757 family)